MDAPLSADTTPAAATLQFAQWRAMTPAAKLEMVRDMNRTVLLLERAGLRHLEPDLDESAVFRRLAIRRLGAELASRVYGPADAAK